jgi:hypothetical protein
MGAVMEAGDASKAIDRALWLVTAWREDGPNQSEQRSWLEGELPHLRDTGDLSEYVESIGTLLAGLVQVSSLFLDGWAASEGTNAAAVMAAVRRMNEVGLAESDSRTIAPDHSDQEN